MADDEKAARKYLDALNASDAPWLQPVGDRATARPAPEPAPKREPARTTADDAADQIARIAERNRDIAKRTRHLRKDY